MGEDLLSSRKAGLIAGSGPEGKPRYYITQKKPEDKNFFQQKYA